MFGTKLKRAQEFLVKKCVNLFFFPASLLMIAGCSSQKDSGYHKAMQNLTAHFNILFNAKEILRQKQVSYATSFIDNYTQVLSVYQDTTPHTSSLDKDLDLATVKANFLINEKEESKYIGDAYLVLGEANYLEGNYFNGVEYFSYVLRSFPKRKDLQEQAAVWKTRTLIYLDQVPQAKPVIDTALAHINPKKHVLADIYAAKLEYDITVADYVDGEEMALQAVHYCHDTNERTRWKFILAQLEELNNHRADAYKNYAKVARSNALFEMAFNAELNMIRMRDEQNGVKRSRQAELMALMKNPDNAEFKDQIYYQVAQILMADKDVDGAIKNYNLSIRKSTKNRTQKGLSYLRLAELYFNVKTDYVRSKRYYDSTLTSLPVTYPGYLAIQKKGNNLALLADRLQIIAREDTLQALALMDEKKRLSVIDQMVSDYVLQQQTQAAAAKANAAAEATQQSSSFSGGSFYFDNASAVGQGASDFKKKFGNRKLEDDWRRSTRASSDVTANTAPSSQSVDPDAPTAGQKAANSTTASNYRKSLMAGLPLTAAQLAQSNLRIYNAYVDIGDFYRDILEDKNEAIKVFEKILRLYPNDPNRPAIYYNLYRLYTDLDAEKSNYYKDKLLKEYPETPFAKIIIDPDFVKKLGDKNAEYATAYNAVFDLYAQKKYKEVIAGVPQMLKQYPGNKYSAQLFYLQTLAQGHAEAVGPFTDSLKQLMAYYPTDKLIIPLVKQHLAYINANVADIQSRDVVLADADPHDIPFTLVVENKKQTNYRKQPRSALPLKPADKTEDKLADKQSKKPNKTADSAAAKPAVPPPAVRSADGTLVAAESGNVRTLSPPGGENPGIVKTNVPTVVPGSDMPMPGGDVPNPAGGAPGSAAARPDQALNGAQAATKPAVAIPSIFSKLDSTNYYFAVSVNSGDVNLASSRFGIGQFNRANYTGQGIKHQLLAVGDSDQVIYVGHFASLDEVKKYARQIVPLLPDIMKAQAAKYSFFIITKENLDKLADRKTLNSYIDYYQSNY
jgi:tetratricopeptide (TPR) repeat protein